MCRGAVEVARVAKTVGAQVSKRVMRRTFNWSESELVFLKSEKVHFCVDPYGNECIGTLTA